MTVTVTHQDVADLCTGSVFLATGGGGDPYISQILVQEALKKYGPVDLLPLIADPNLEGLALGGHVGPREGADEAAQPIAPTAIPNIWWAA